MKTQYRIVSALLAAIMCLCLTTPAFAADPDEAYGKMTISIDGQTVVFDEAYTKDPVTVTTTFDGEVFTPFTLTPLVIKPDSHMTVTGGENDTLEVTIYLNSHNEDFIAPSALGGCQGTTGSVSQIFDYDWTTVNSEKNQEKAYFIIPNENGGKLSFYWLQTGDETTNSNAATEQETVTAPSKPTEQPAQQSKPSTSTGNYSNSYTDVQPGAWYYDAIMTMTENGVLAGYGNGKFGPDDIITDAQLEVIMNRLVKLYNSNTSVDWASAKPLTRGEAAIYIVDVLNNGKKSQTITDGMIALADETGIPYYTDPLMYSGKPYMNSRMLAVWFRLFHDEGRRVSDVRLSAADFPDSAAVLSCAEKWATDNENRFLGTHEQIAAVGVKFICTAWNLGMFSGYDAAGTFGANDTITRAQICQALYNMGFTSEDCILG